MNILIISAVFPPEPVVSAKLSEDLAMELSRKNNVTVFAPRPSRPFGFKLSNINKNKYPFELLIANSFICPESKVLGRLKESYSYGLASKNYIKKNHSKIDLIYINTWPIFAQAFVIREAKKFKIPVITHVQDVYPEAISSKVPSLFSFFINLTFLPLDKYILRNSENVIAISEKMKLYLKESRGLDSSKIKVVTNWQNEKEFMAFHDSQKTEEKNIVGFTFMYLGNIGPIAGVELLINAFNEANLINSRLIIAGSGSRKDDLLNLVINKNYKNISFLDVPNGEVSKIQELSNVLLLPIKKGAASSSVPSKLPAYMFSKKPIISCVDIESETANVIKQADCGWIVAPENKELLINKMREVHVLGKKELIRKGNAGFNFAIKNLSKEANLKKLVEVITPNS